MSGPRPGADGVPSVWWWFGWAFVANAMSMIMGLAAIIDAQIGDSVTPMLVGSLVYGSVGLVGMVIATRAAAATLPDDDGSTARSQPANARRRFSIVT